MTRSKTSSSSRDVVNRQNQRFHELMRQLTQLEYLAKGTVLVRMMKCGKPQCACHSEPSKRHGPYYEWTYKSAGRTVNVRLTSASAPIYQHAVAQYKKLKVILDRLEKLSRQALVRLAKQADRTASKTPKTDR
jgi:hypothetical protein